MKSLKRAIHQSILRSDLLSSPASLRYKGEPEYESFCPGIVSIILVSIFAAIFVLKFSSILELNEINAEEHLSNNLESAEPITDLYFALGVRDLNVSQLQKYFEFKLTEHTYQTKAEGKGLDRTERDIPLTLCTFDHWQNYNIGDMDEVWSKSGISGLLCPDESFSIQGVSSQETYKYISLRLTACRTTSSACLSSADRSTFMSDFINTNDYFTVTLFVKDSIISPTNQDPVSNYIETDMLLTFSETTGSFGNIKIADYNIETDVSVYPWSTYQSHAGYYIERFQASGVPTNNDRFLYVQFEKSSKAMKVERQYGKFDDMLSYVGGLFGILFVSVQFFMMSYNEYRYELSVGEVLFNYNEKGDQIKEEDFGFLTYMKYSLYDWMDLFGCPPQSWEETKKIHETRTQACEQLDIRYLMRKIRYLENVVEVLISDDQRVCLLLNELPSMNKIKKVRKISEFYNETAEEGRQKDLIKEKDLSNQSLVGREIISKRVIPEEISSVNSHKVEDIYDNGGQNSLKYFDVPEVSADINLTYEENNSEETIANEVSLAYLRLGNKINDPINQKILNRIPREMVRSIENKSINRNRKKSFETIDLDIIDRKDQSKKKIKSTKEMRRSRTKN